MTNEEYSYGVWYDEWDDRGDCAVLIFPTPEKAENFIKELTERDIAVLYTSKRKSGIQPRNSAHALRVSYPWIGWKPGERP